jgi:hypothetical protein
MSLDNSRAICHVCNTPFSSIEACYLDLADTTQITLEEFIRIQEENLARRKVATLPPMLPQCSGICKSGKKCIKVAMRSSGVFCNVHIPK